MALSYSFGAQSWLSTSVATTVYTISGLSFQPKALRFYTVGASSSTDALSNTLHGQRCIGFATSTSDQRCVASQSKDNSASAGCGAVYLSNACMATVDVTAGTPSTTGILKLNSITSDGFTLIVDDQVPVTTAVFWEAWGGSDITGAGTVEISEPAATGDQDYTFAPFTSGGTHQVVMFAGTCAVNDATPIETHSAFTAGFATSGADANNVVFAGSSEVGAATMVVGQYAKAGECIANYGAAKTLNAHAKLTQFNNGGFRLNWTERATTGRKYIALCIKGGSWDAQKVMVATGTLSSTVSITGLLYTPKGVSIVGYMDIEATSDTSRNFDIMWLGNGSSPTARQVQSYTDLDAQPTSSLGIGVQYDQIGMYTETGTPAMQFAWDIQSIDAAGITFIVDVALGGGSTNFTGCLTFGDGTDPVGGTPSPGKGKGKGNGGGGNSGGGGNPHDRFFSGPSWAKRNYPY